MGPGFDLDLLKKDFQVTGSDKSKYFLEIYHKNNPRADLLLLDAITLKTERKFDCIFSNKVLHHLTKTELKTSFLKQKQLMKQNGILFHTFWRGDKAIQYQDLNFNQYPGKEIKNLVKKHYKIIEMQSYSELNFNDSILIILKPK